MLIEHLPLTLSTGSETLTQMFVSRYLYEISQSEDWPNLWIHIPYRFSRS